MATGENSPLNPGQKLDEAQAQYRQMLSAYHAASTDADRGYYGQQLISLGTAYVKADDSYNASSSSLAYDEVRGDLQRLGLALGAGKDVDVAQNQQIIDTLQAQLSTAKNQGANQTASLENLNSSMMAARNVLDGSLAQLTTIAARMQSGAGLGVITKPVWSAMGSDQINDASYALAKSTSPQDLTQFLSRADELNLYRGHWSYSSPVNIPQWDSTGDQAALQWERDRGYTGGWNTGANIFLIANNLVDSYNQWQVDYAHQRGWDVKGYASGGLVTGGPPGIDTVPAWLNNGERVFSVPHSQMIETIYTMANGVVRQRYDGIQPPTSVGGSTESISQYLSIIASEIKALRREFVSLTASGIENAAHGFSGIAEAMHDSRRINLFNARIR